MVYSFIFSFTALPTLNNKLAGFEPVLDETGKMTGYKTGIGGADTVFPFNSGIHYVMTTYSYLPDHIVMVDENGAILMYNSHHNSTAYTVEYEHFQYYRGNNTSNIIREPSRITAKVKLRYAQCVGLGIPSSNLATLNPGDQLQLYHGGDYVSTIIWPD